MVNFENVATFSFCSNSMIKYCHKRGEICRDLCSDSQNLPEEIQITFCQFKLDPRDPEVPHN